eukprot:2577302-Karenia_brevis.AAC.2
MENTATAFKKRHAAFTSPNFGTQHDFESDPDGSAIHVEIPLPSFRARQILAARQHIIFMLLHEL